LDVEPLQDPSPTPPFQVPPREGILSKIFLNDKGVRGGWRLLIYAAFVAGLGFGGGLVLRQFVRPSHGVFSPGYMFIQEAFSFSVIFAAAVIMAQIERQSVGVYGLPIRGAFGKLFWQGCLIGLVEISALVGLIAAFGGYSFGGLAIHGREVLRWGVLWAVFFVFVGLFEEFLFRGYTQYTLADSIGFWPAAVVLSCSFGAVHLGNPGEGWVGAAGVAAIGLVFAFALRRLLELACLHDRRVQVKIMRHNGRAQNADADVKHLLVHDDVRAGHKTAHYAQEIWFGKDQLGAETAGDGCDQRDHQRFDITKTLLLKVKNGEHI